MHPGTSVHLDETSTMIAKSNTILPGKTSIGLYTSVPDENRETSTQVYPETSTMKQYFPSLGTYSLASSTGYIPTTDQQHDTSTKVYTPTANQQQDTSTKVYTPTANMQQDTSSSVYYPIGDFSTSLKLNVTNPEMGRSLKNQSIQFLENDFGL